MNIYESSPNMSIYDQETPDRWGHCNSSLDPKHLTQDNFMSHDSYQLDDKLEDSTLQKLLTPEIMTTLATPISSEYLWGGKPESSSAVNDCTGSNPTLAELNMESDLSIQDILDLDSTENSTMELICNAINTKSGTLTSQSTVDSSHPFACLPTSTQNNTPKVVASKQQTNQRKPDDINYFGVRNSHSFTNNFPPRASQPPLVGVVNPTLIKKEIDHTVSENLKPASCSNSPQVKSPCLHDLLKRSPSIKSPLYEKPHAKLDPPAQIVPPSSGRAAKRDIDGYIKAEPSSPPRRGSLRSEESIEEKWKDIEDFIHKPEERSPKRQRWNSGGSGHTSDDYEDDITAGGDPHADDTDDDFSDIDEDITRFKPSECESLINTGKKQKQFFWQYNVQAKGPKGTRLKLSIEKPADPHVLNDFEDPVFDEGNTSVAGIRHGGKARKGDGNEISPNPKKLFMIGHQLRRLNKNINACQIGPDVPTPQRNEAKKEKNKLASRACRLKKKAQHEANKIKLFGLEQEHCEMNDVIRSIWPMLRDKAKARMGQQPSPSAPNQLTSQSLTIQPLNTQPLTSQSLMPQSLTSQSLTDKPLTQALNTLTRQKLHTRIAEKTVDYVNSVILNVEKGAPSGGLDIRRRHKT